MNAQHKQELRDGRWAPLDDDTLDAMTEESWEPGNFGMRALAAECWRLRRELRELKEKEPPEQAWYRGGSYMRDVFQTQAKLSDNDPLWAVEIPEYKAP